MTGYTKRLTERCVGANALGCFHQMDDGSWRSQWLDVAIQEVTLGGAAWKRLTVRSRTSRTVSDRRLLHAEIVKQFVGVDAEAVEFIPADHSSIPARVRILWVPLGTKFPFSYDLA